MAASISAVASTCVTAPAITHGQNRSPGRGSAAPVTMAMPARKTRANGKPNRERMCVAPTVRGVAVSSRGIALRAVWPTAATRVNTAHSQCVSNMRGRESVGGSGGALGGQHVVHVHVVGELPAVGENVVDD